MRSRGAWTERLNTERLDTDGRPRGVRAGTLSFSDIAIEAVLITALLAIQLAVTTVLDHEDTAYHPLDPLAYLLLIAGPLGLVLRRVDPAAPLLVALPAFGVYFVRDYVPGPVFLAVAAALIIAQYHGRRRAAWLSVAVFVVFVTVCAVTGLGQVLAPGQAFGTCAAAVVATGIGELARVRRESARQRARAETEQARRMSSEQRVELARELHDVLAHSLSVINVQAGVALHLLDDPDQVRDSLHIIRNTSAETLAEVRDTLNSLRGNDAAPTAPAVGLSGLDRLVRASRDAGVTARVIVDPAGDEVPARVSMAAYRIVQEALTNIAKHSAATDARVEIRRDGEVVVVRINDDGPAKPPAQDGGGSGNGIEGMRERAVALGGELHAAPTRSGGFLVEARLPGVDR